MKNTPNYKPSDLYTLFGQFQTFIKQYLGSNLGTVQPVEVVGVDGAFVNVKPLIQQLNTQNKPIEITDDDIIYNIPAMKFKGGGAELQYVPLIGDQGLLIASKFDISNYKKNKSRSVIGSLRSFNWADGFFLPLSFSSNSSFIIKKGSSIIELTDSEINITAGTVNLIGDVNLGGIDGQPVARLGDQVTVAGKTGTITSASSKVKSV